VRLTAGSFNAANLNKNLFVLSMTATVLTVMPLNGVALVAEGPVASATVSVPGKKTYAPTSGHTDVSFAFEHYFADITQSELFLGCKVNRLALELPPSGIATLSLDLMGKDVTAAGSAYFTTPTAETTTGVMAAVNGIVSVQGAAVAVLTGLTINVNGNMTAEPVVGANTYPDIFEGRVLVDGQFTAFFEDATYANYFRNETEVAIHAAFSDSNDADAEFVALSLPRIKVGGAGKDDGEKGLIQTLPFQALLNTAGGAATATEATTLAVQDSQA